MKTKAMLTAAILSALSLASPAMAGWGHPQPNPPHNPAPTPVPEPTDAVLLLMGVAGVAIGRRMQKRRKR